MKKALNFAYVFIDIRTKKIFGTLYLNKKITEQDVVDVINYDPDHEHPEDITIEKTMVVQITKSRAKSIYEALS